MVGDAQRDVLAALITDREAEEVQRVVRRIPEHTWLPGNPRKHLLQAVVEEASHDIHRRLDLDLSVAEQRGLRLDLVELVIPVARTEEGVHASAPRVRE